MDDLIIKWLVHYNLRKGREKSLHSCQKFQLEKTLHYGEPEWEGALKLHWCSAGKALASTTIRSTCV